MSKSVERLKNLIFSILIDANIEDELRQQVLMWYRSSAIPIDMFGSKMRPMLEEVAKRCSNPKLRVAFFDLLVCEEDWEEKPDLIFKLYMDALAKTGSDAINIYNVALTLKRLIERGLELEHEWKLLIDALGESQTIKVLSNCPETIWEKLEYSNSYIIFKKVKEQDAINQRIVVLCHLVALCRPDIFSGPWHDYTPICYHQLREAVNDWIYWHKGSAISLVFSGAIVPREQEIIESFGVGLANCLKAIPDNEIWEKKLRSSSRYQKLGTTTLQELCQGKNILDVIYLSPSSY